MSSLVIRFSTISPVAKTSPVVSTAVMSMTTIIEMIAAMLNFGMPKKNGVVRPNHEDSATAVEVCVAEDPGDRGADDQAGQHGDGGHEPAEDPLDDDDQRERAHRIREVLAAGRVHRGAGATGGVVGRDRQQGDADDE